jgi:predicted phosphodiesterase
MGILLAGCDSPPVQSAAISVPASISGSAQPWTGLEFDSDPRRFTFAIHADLTGGERDGIFAVAVEQLNLLRPEFIISVGDLVEGSDDEAELDRQWDAFDTRARAARAPVFYVAGNHDRTGELMQQVWARRNGPGYYHFRYKDVLFLVLDTEDNTPERMQHIQDARRKALEFIAVDDWDAFNASEYATLPENQAGNITPAQSQYMIDAISANSDVRHTFLFMHKAPWLREDLTAFRDIEDALADQPYTVFHGHVHSYQYQARNGRDYIRLATTGGVFMPAEGRSVDHIMLVTVDDNGVDIANLLLQGILDKTGQLPLDGDALCLDALDCPNDD